MPTQSPQPKPPCIVIIPVTHAKLPANWNEMLLQARVRRLALRRHEELNKKGKAYK